MAFRRVLMAWTPGLTYPADVGTSGVRGTTAPAFERALAELRAARLRPEVRVTEVPAPQRIAPYAVALTAEVVTNGEDDELASGRFVLLHDPGHSLDERILREQFG